ncbi:MAG: hypothetical protein WCC48_10825 [Anaeromyxobacteraceae bacterium]
MDTPETDEHITYLRVPAGGPLAIAMEGDAGTRLDALSDLAESMGVTEAEASAALSSFPLCDYAQADVDAYYGWWSWAVVDAAGNGYVELEGGEWGQPKRSTFAGAGADLRKLVLNKVIGSCEEYCGMAGEDAPRKKEYSVKVLRGLARAASKPRRAPARKKRVAKKTSSAKTLSRGGKKSKKPSRSTGR